MLQSVADYQPDVDAIFRLTRKTPFTFRRPRGGQEGLFYNHIFQIGKRSVKSVIIFCINLK